MLDTGTVSPRPHTNYCIVCITASPIAAATANVVTMPSTLAAATTPASMISIGCGSPNRFHSGSNKGITILPRAYNAMSGMTIQLIPIRIPINMFIIIILVSFIC